MHKPILTEAEYRAGIVGSTGRFREGVRQKRHRIYALRGLLWCGACGNKLHGQTRANRGKEWSYYLCRHCGAPSVPAQPAEDAVMDAIRTPTLPMAAIERARAILLERLRVPETGTIDTQRKRLMNRLTRLRDLYSWGDMPEGEYRAKVAETQRLIAELPDEDKIVLFDRHRKVVESMAANLDRATPEQKADLIRLLVQSAKAEDRVLVADAIVWTPPVRPFFEHVDDVAERPRTDSNRQQQRSVLDYYLEVG